MRSAKTQEPSVEQYLAELPAERRALLQSVRELILKNKDAEIAEGFQYGMIGYHIPHSVYPAGYHVDPKQPLPFAALASQKNHASLYLMFVYADEGLRQDFVKRWLATGKKLDMGKSCIRFTRLDQLALDVLEQTFRGVTARDYVEQIEATLSGRQAQPSRRSTKKAAKKASRKASSELS